MVCENLQAATDEKDDEKKVDVMGDAKPSREALRSGS
jgi:hypothetical protein